MAKLMCADKAILTDVACIVRPFESGTAGLINYVIATNSEMAWRIEETFDFLTSALGFGERSIAAYLTAFLNSSEWLEELLSKMPESERPADEVFWSTLDTLRNSIKLAAESGSYKNQVHEDFAIAAADWMAQGFKCIVYSGWHDREKILDVLECAGLTDGTVAVKVPRDENADWLEDLSRDLSLDLTASFLITAHTFGARDIRRRFQLKTAVLESSIYERSAYRKPYDERGYYLVIGSFLDIDPAPNGVDQHVPIADDTSLAPYLKARIK